MNHAPQKARRAGRPRRGPQKRVRACFTLPPTDITWLSTQAKEKRTSRSEALEACIRAARQQSEATKTNALSLVEKFPGVYWDISAKAIQGPEHDTFVIERMLEKGTLEGVRQMLKTFSAKKIAQVVVHSRRISQRTALFWKHLLAIKEPIKCLAKESPSPLLKRWQ